MESLFLSLTTHYTLNNQEAKVREVQGCPDLDSYVRGAVMMMIRLETPKPVLVIMPLLMGHQRDSRGLWPRTLLDHSTQNPTGWVLISCVF